MGPNRQEFADSVTFSEEILNGKIYILCSEFSVKTNVLWIIFLK